MTATDSSHLRAVPGYCSAHLRMRHRCWAKPERRIAISAGVRVTGLLLGRELRAAVAAAEPGEAAEGAEGNQVAVTGGAEVGLFVVILVNEVFDLLFDFDRGLQSFGHGGVSYQFVGEFGLPGRKIRAGVCAPARQSMTTL